MKKQVSFLFAALLLLTAAAAHAVSGDAGNGYTYTIENDVLILSGSGPMKDYGKFTDTAPWTLQPIRAAVFPAGVTHIGKWTIHENTMLQTIVFLGTTAPELDGDWVYDPSYSTPKNVVVPQGSEANFTTTFDPAKFNIVPTGGTAGDANWSVNLTTGVLTLDSSLEDVPVGIPNYSKKGEAPWYACAPCIKRVEVSKFIESIGTYAFAGCYNLTSVKFMDQSSINNMNAFDDTALSAIEIRLADYEYYSQFSWWDSMKEKVTCCDYVISGTDGNVSWDFDPVEATLTLSGKGAMNNYNYDWDYTYTEDNLTTAPWASLYDKIEKVVINEGITSVGSYAFLGLKKLTSVEFPVSLTSIGDGAFESCAGLESLNLPVGLQAIGNAAFSKCSSVTTMNIPAGVTKLSYLFSDVSAAFTMTLTCYGTIPPTLTGGFPYYIWEDAKLIVPYGCTGAYEAAGYKNYFKYIQEMDAPASGTDGNIKWTLNPGTGELLIEKNPSATAGTMNDYEYSSLPWSESETGIASDCITRITVASGVTSIGIGAFKEFEKVQMVTLPEGLTSIGAAAFSFCGSLKVVTLPSTVTSLGYQAFEYCSSLVSVSIPAGLTTIPDHAFVSCSSLTEVNLDNVTVIEISAFEGCSALKHTGSLEKVQEINMCAFSGCSSLETVELCDIRAIDMQAFEGCSSLKQIDIYSKTPCSIALESVFDGCPSSLQIRVPLQSCEDYQAKWGENYQDMITYLPYLFYARWKTAGATDWTYIDLNEYMMNPNPVLTITDGSYDAFEVMEETPFNVTYVRNFANANTPLPWYMPFDFTLTADILSKFEFDKIEGVMVEDGKWYIGYVKMKEGESVYANVPYIIKAKTAGSGQKLEFTNVTLKPTEEFGFSLTSASNVFTFTGLYAKRTTTETVKDWYVVTAKGEFSLQNRAGLSVGAFRFILNVNDRIDNPYVKSSSSSSVEIGFRCLDGDDEATSIGETPVMNETPAIIYDVTGRKVENPSNGVYIVNGKKVFIK